MKRCAWQPGPKRNTQRGKRECRRLQKLQMMAATAKKMEDEARGERRELIHGQEKFLHGKNVDISDLKGRNAALKKKLKDANNQLDKRKVCIHAVNFILENVLTLHIYI